MSGIEDTLDRWIREEDDGRRADAEHRAARRKLAAIRTRVEESVPALIDEHRRLSMRIKAIESALRAERSILSRDLEALAPVGSVAPLEEWRARAVEGGIRGALDRIEEHLS